MWASHWSGPAQMKAMSLPRDAARRDGQLDAEAARDGVGEAARCPLRAVTSRQPAFRTSVAVTPGIARAAAVAAGSDGAIERRHGSG